MGQEFGERTGRLAGRVALISGAASGIGAACAGRFAREGASVAGLDVRDPDAEAWAEVGKHAPAHGFWEADVREEAAIETAVRKARDLLGPIDILVNAAGVTGMGSVADLDAAEWDRVLDVNLKGTYLLSKHVVGEMVERERGSIVNLASIEGMEGMESQAAYNASKGGVILLTKNMACDFSPHGVRVNCLCPGYIETPMTALLKAEGLEAVREKFVSFHLMGRPGQPEEVAGAALFLASEDASFVTGHALTVDGGFTAGRRLTPP